MSTRILRAATVLGLLIGVAGLILAVAAAASSRDLPGVSATDVRCAPTLDGGLVVAEHAGAHRDSAPGASATGIVFIDYFTGGGAYMPRTHCLVNERGETDWVWVVILLALTTTVVIAYLRIFRFWMRCYFIEDKRDRNPKLFDLATIFLLCATCGYAMSIVMFFWPGYRLLAIFLLALNFFSWRFCMSLGRFSQVFMAGRLERELREEVESRASQLERLVGEVTAELGESERRFRTLVQNLPGAAFRIKVDAAWTPVFVSDGIEKITGYPASEFTGPTARSCASVTHADDLGAIDEAAERAIRERASYTVEYRIVRADGSIRWVLEQGQAVYDEHTGEPLYLDGLQFDITERKRAEAEMQHNSLHDRLTGLPNRAMLIERLRAAVTRAASDPTWQYAVLFLDFDRFKMINDSLGHDAGDAMLNQIACRLSTAMIAHDSMAHSGGMAMAGRLGGDEFVVILDGLKSPSEAMQTADWILAVCREPFEVGGHTVISTVSIGVVTSDEAKGSPEDILRDADSAMYRAKLAGKGRAVVFDGAMRDRARERLLLEEELRAAVAEDRLSVAYQPIVSVETGRFVAVEALARWSNPRRGDISPGEFIPIAEECGLINQIGDWVLRRAATDFVGWRREFGDVMPELMSVNLSRSQLACTDLPSRVASLLAEIGLEPARLQLEITENQVAGSGANNLEPLHRLRAIGVKLAMDDFGTGLSSFSDLHMLPIDVIKIDRSFVQNLSHGVKFMALARSIIELASNLGMKTVAEGIETGYHLAALQALGCAFGQGYLFARPMPGDEFLRCARTNAADARSTAA